MSRGAAVLAWCAVLVAAAAGVTHALPGGRGAHPRQVVIGVIPERQARLEINDLGMFVLNDGRFAWDLDTFDAGLEYPRGSGRFALFTAGLWVAGRVGGEVRASVAEFNSSWVPGPAGGPWPAPDPSRHKVFRITRGDTTGRAEWKTLAASLGAPATPSGDPLDIGDQTLWTVFSEGTGIEARLTAWAFDRPGSLRRAAFLRWRMIHRGAAPLDSAAIGAFFDPRTGGDALRAASDTTRDMGYAHRATDPVSGEAVAIGLLWLGGPSVGGARMRPTSYVAYANGADPMNAVQFDWTLRGLLPWGAAMVDSSTGLPTTFFSSGDPVAGTGWNATVPPHPHTVLAAEPFTFTPGDTLEVDIAVVVGHGADRLGAVLDLRDAADEARARWTSGFSDLPAFEPWPAPGRLLAYPNPAGTAARVSFRVEGAMEPVRAIVYDAAGRRVRLLLEGLQVSGRHVIDWDGMDDAGRRTGAGLYFVRMTIGGREFTARVVRLSGS